MTGTRELGPTGALVLAGALCVIGTLPAMAQTVATTAPSTTADDSSIGEIVVTAQRRSELQKDVPISITSISAAQLTQTDARQLTDIQQITPALRFDNNGPFTQPTIRGVGTAVASSGGGADVGIYIDGFYSPNPLSADSQLLNVDSIQVLKGPQGTLFGRNTTGGAILITTSKPSQDTSAIVQASYGRFNTQQYEGYATTGVTDKLAVDIEGVVNTGNGFQHNIITGDDKSGQYDNWSARAGIKYDPTEDLSFLLRYQHSAVNDPTTQLGGSYPGSVVVTGGIAATQPNDVANIRPTNFNSFSNVLQLTASLNLPFATLTSYTQGRWDTSQSYINQDYSSLSSFALSIPVYNRTLSQEFLLASQGDSKLKWTTGLFFFDNSDQWEEIRLAFGAAAPLIPFTSSGTDTRSSAAFVDLTYEALEDFFVTVGARYSHDEVLDPFFTNLFAATGKERIYLDPVKTNVVTPRVVLRYKPDDSSSVYASFTKGYKAPILNVGGGTSVVFDGTQASLAPLRVASENIKAYEIGYKYGHGPFSADLAAYHYDYTNLQVASYIGTASLINNAATAKIDGVEGEVHYRAWRSLDVNLGANYMNARYGNYPDATFYDAQPGGSYVPVSGPASGNEMQRAPKLTGNLGARYSVDLGGGEAAVSATVYHTSKVYFVASDQFSQDGYTTLNLRGEWTDPSKRYTFALYGDNVTNKRYITQVPLGNNGIGAVWNYPVTYGISARAKF